MTILYIKNSYILSFASTLISDNSSTKKHKTIIIFCVFVQNIV